VISVPCCSGSAFARDKRGVRKCRCRRNLSKSIRRPCHSRSPLRVVQTSVTEPRRAVAILKPIPKRPRLSIGLFPDHPARTARSSMSGVMPGPLSMIRRVAAGASACGKWTSTFAPAIELPARLSFRNPSTALSTSSATQRHWSMLISPSIGKTRGSGSRLKSLASCRPFASMLAITRVPH